MNASHREKQCDLYIQLEFFDIRVSIWQKRNVMCMELVQGLYL